ncbi:hypothetical protein SDC9_109420 [bioreactor metagenome]|uniref:Uncharacterized protein n=1 Tax=bioreactor metagenome TaxID=1076179 RepID=A0A645BAX1_9ZZZZ
MSVCDDIAIFIYDKAGSLSAKLIHSTNPLKEIVKQIIVIRITGSVICPFNTYAIVYIYNGWIGVIRHFFCGADLRCVRLYVNQENACDDGRDKNNDSRYSNK